MTTKGAGGYILLHRKLLEHALMLQLPAAWLRIWIAILLRANWKPGTWWDGRREVTIPAGSMVTSVDKLRRMSRSSVQQVRSCLNYLSTTGSITIRTTSHFTVITVTHWATYQNPETGDNKPEDKADNEPLTNQQQSDNKPTTTIEEGNQGNHERRQPSSSPGPMVCTPTSADDDEDGKGHPDPDSELLGQYIQQRRSTREHEAALPAPATVRALLAVVPGWTGRQLIAGLEDLERHTPTQGPIRSERWFARVAADLYQRFGGVAPAPSSWRPGSYSDGRTVYREIHDDQDDFGPCPSCGDCGRIGTRFCSCPAGQRAREAARPPRPDPENYHRDPDKYTEAGFPRRLL